jgi:hypothetical protein
MNTKYVRTLTTATPLALATLVTAASPAGAAISEATLTNPRVLNNGNTLSVQFSTTATSTTDTAATAAAAQNVVQALGGGWISGLIAYAVQNAPQQRPSTCHVTVTAKDPSGATGTASATLAPGTTTTELDIQNQTRGTNWGIGDSDNFQVQLACTDGNGNQRRVTVDEDQIAM